MISSEAHTLHGFEPGYLPALKNEDPETQDRFALYFGKEIRAWLRLRLRDKAEVDDLCQETLCRVLVVLKQSDGLRDPNCLPQFVRSVCKNVLFEHWRAVARYPNTDDCCFQNTDGRPDPEQVLASADNCRRLRDALQALQPQDRQILSMVYFEERDRAEVCRNIGVSQTYLRVLIHRAIRRLRSLLSTTEGRAPALAPFGFAADRTSALHNF